MRRSADCPAIPLRNSLVPLQSSISAGCTTTAKSQSWVSTTICRLRLFTFLVGVIAPGNPTTRGFNTLAVDHARTGNCRLADQAAGCARHILAFCPRPRRGSSLALSRAHGERTGNFCRFVTTPPLLPSKETPLGCTNSREEVPCSLCCTCTCQISHYEIRTVFAATSAGVDRPPPQAASFPQVRHEKTQSSVNVAYRHCGRNTQAGRGRKANT